MVEHIGDEPPDVQAHKHERETGCLCHNRWPEQGPNPECPEHGYPWPPRCATCGQFIPWDVSGCCKREEEDAD